MLCDDDMGGVDMFEVADMMEEMRKGLDDESCSEGTEEV
jgi:hypothetical protein